MRHVSIGMATYEEMRVMMFCRRGPSLAGFFDAYNKFCYTPMTRAVGGRRI